MAIEVTQLIEMMDEAADDGTVFIRHNGIVLYAQTVEIKDGDVIIISSDESDKEDYDF